MKVVSETSIEKTFTISLETEASSQFMVFLLVLLPILHHLVKQLRKQLLYLL